MPVKHAQSPLAPKMTPTLPRVGGVKLAAARSGVRYKDRDDVMLVVVPAGAPTPRGLTPPQTPSGPVGRCPHEPAPRNAPAPIANAPHPHTFTPQPPPHPPHVNSPP